jgi:hypothetical protein
MNASGGAAAPIAGDPEQFGTNEPKKSVDEDSTSTKQGTKRDEPHDGLPTSNLEQKFTKLDEDEVNISTASTRAEERDARAQRRADAVGESRSKGSDEAKKFGGHADVEELHGATSLESGSGDQSGKGGKGGDGKKDSDSGSEDKFTGDENGGEKDEKK